MTAFATVGDVENLLKTSYAEGSADRLLVEELLEDAAEHLRDIIGGAQVYPQITSTFELEHSAGDRWLDIPVKPLISIDAMSVDGVPVTAPKAVDGAVRLCGPATVVLTVTHGYATAPPILRSYNRILVSQALQTLLELGTLGSGEVTSFGIDDYHKGFKTGDDQGVFELPLRVEQRLRNRFGTTVYVVGTR